MRGKERMDDPDNGRYKALLFAGIGYSLVAIVGSGVYVGSQRC